MTTAMVDLAEYLHQRARPAGRPAMFQSWYDLLFVHYPVCPEVIRALLPAGLDVDTFPDEDGVDQAWIGVVPFGMRGIRPPLLPAMPWISAFLETNVRTYVHRSGSDPGVWFFSLDAARWIACAVARATYLLPYHHARMVLNRSGNHVRYDMQRSRGGQSLTAQYDIGAPIEVPAGSFEFWLVERYRLYALGRRGLMTGLVHHHPYAVRQAVLTRWDTDLPQASGLPMSDPRHVVYSPGVDVEVWGIQPI